MARAQFKGKVTGRETLGWAVLHSNQMDFGGWERKAGEEDFAWRRRSELCEDALKHIAKCSIGITHDGLLKWASEQKKTCQRQWIESNMSSKNAHKHYHGNKASLGNIATSLYFAAVKLWHCQWVWLTSYPGSGDPNSICHHFWNVNDDRTWQWRSGCRRTSKEAYFIQMDLSTLFWSLNGRSSFLIGVFGMATFYCRCAF